MIGSLSIFFGVVVYFGTIHPSQLDAMHCAWRPETAGAFLVAYLEVSILPALEGDGAVDQNL